MDRVEAYSLLSERLERIGSSDAHNQLSESFSYSEDVNGKVGSVLYTINIRVERCADGTRVLLGSIHDNNTAKFSLLEERKSLGSGGSTANGDEGLNPII